MFFIACGDDSSTSAGNLNDDGISSKSSSSSAKSSVTATMQATAPSTAAFTSGQSTAGQKLKLATGWTAYSGITNEDAFAFSALPAGFWGLNGDYDNKGNNAYFWSSTEDDSDFAYYMRLNYSLGSSFLDYDYKDYGFSVH